MPRVTENLRRQWRDIRDQSVEFKRDSKTDEERAQWAFEIKMSDILLALPLGTKFDAQEIQKDLLKSLTDGKTSL